MTAVTVPLCTEWLELPNWRMMGREGNGIKREERGQDSTWGFPYRRRRKTNKIGRREHKRDGRRKTREGSWSKIKR